MDILSIKERFFMTVTWKIPLKPGGLFILVGGMFLILPLIFLTIAGVQARIQQGYQAGQCTIIGKQLQQTTDTQSTANYDYAPYFRYIVHTTDGRSYTTGGYDGTNTYSSDQAGQQAVLDQYQVQKTYPCWYDPSNPAQAVLVRHANWLLLLIGGVFLLISLPLIVAGIVMIIYNRRRIFQ